MKSRSASEWVKAYDTIHQEVTVKGFKPQLQTLDNEASTALKNFLTTNDIAYQLVPPQWHRHNAAEHAIRTFKEHFVAGLSSIEALISTALVGKTTESPPNLETTSATVCRRQLPRPCGLQQNSLCSARMQNHCTRETR
jgi:hypothetical protein